MKTTRIVELAFFIAIVTTMTYINIPLFTSGGLIHLGYIALFPIAIVYGKYYGFTVGAIGMTLFDVLSQWFAWAPATFVIVGLVGYVVGTIAKDGRNYLLNIIAMLVGSIISVSGYFIFNAFIMNFGVQSALVSASGDTAKVLVSLVVALFLIKPLQSFKKFRS